MVLNTKIIKTIVIKNIGMARRICYSNVVHFSGGNPTMGYSVWAQDGMGDGHQKAYSQD